MKIDMLFFLGLFYVIFGAIAFSGWFIVQNIWNFYGLIMFIIGLILVIIRPKPPLRFFIGRVSKEDVEEDQGESMDMIMSHFYQEDD